MIEENNYIQFKKLKNKNEIAHLYTKKKFNFNKQQMSENDIDLQYKEIQNIIDYQCKKIIIPIQSHTNIVKKVDNNNLNNNFENVDGLITNLKGIALVTYTADCQGILLYDNTKKVIGNIHSGWKGTLYRIIHNAINIMIEDYECDVKNIEVYVCPSILKCCFEVDEEVKEQFLKEFKDIPINKFILNGKIKEEKQKYCIDTISINIEVLKKIGIPENNIFNSNICTKCNQNKYHSYRGEKENSGRNIAFIVLK